MLMILNRICAFTLVGFVILLVRRLWGKALYPQFITGLWALFFIFALFPFRTIDRGTALIERGKPYGELDFSVVNFDYDAEANSRMGYGNDLIAQYRRQQNVIEGITVIWLAGMTVAVVYKCYNRGKLRKLIKKDVKYKVPKDYIYITEQYGPFVYGIKPAVYIPESVLEKPQTFESAVLHEKMHIKRKHHLVLQLMELVSCIYWFLPYIHKLFWQALREDMEFRCDYELIKGGAVEPKEYALKRVTYLMQNTKNRRQTAYAVLAALVPIMVCVAGIGYYFKEDVRGFTKQEVREAKETLIEYFEASNAGDLEKAYTLCYPEGPAGRRYNLDNAYHGKSDLYYIFYEPETMMYHAAEKLIVKEGLNPDDCIMFLANINQHLTSSEQYTPLVSCILVREHVGAEWKVYGGGYI